MNRPGNLRVEIEVTTAASGDVGHQALVFSLCLWKPFPWGAAGLVVGLETVSLETVCGGLGFGTTFSEFSTLLSCIFRTHVRCRQLAVSPRPRWFGSFCLQLFSSSPTPGDGLGWKNSKSSRWSRTPLSLFTFASLFLSCSRSYFSAPNSYTLNQKAFNQRPE